MTVNPSLNSLRKQFYGGNLNSAEYNFLKAAQTAGLTASQALTAGRELGYAQVTSGKTSTNTGVADADPISGLTVTVVGTGRPVVIEFFASGAIHSVANDFIIMCLTTNAVGAVGTAPYCALICPSTSVASDSPYLAVRRVLTSGTSYTFGIGVQTQAATATIQASATAPMWLAVTER